MEWSRRIRRPRRSCRCRSSSRRLFPFEMFGGGRRGTGYEGGGRRRPRFLHLSFIRDVSLSLLSALLFLALFVVIGRRRRFLLGPRGPGPSQPAPPPPADDDAAAEALVGRRTTAHKTRMIIHAPTSTT